MIVFIAILAIAQTTTPSPTPRTSTSTRIECATSRDLYKLALDAAKQFELCALNLQVCHVARTECEVRMQRLRAHVFGVPLKADASNETLPWWLWPGIVVAALSGITVGILAGRELAKGDGS